MNNNFNMVAWQKDFMDRVCASPLNPAYDDGGGGDKGYSVYRYRLQYGLSNALAQRYPACQYYVGHEGFGHLSWQYCQQYLPANPIMAHYGEDFPDFLNHQDKDIPDFLGDLAALENNMVKSWHAPDGEKISDIAYFADWQEHKLFAAHFHIAADVFMLSSPYDILQLYRQFQGKSASATPLSHDLSPYYLLIVRTQQRVELSPLSPALFHLVHVIGQGEHMEAAMMAALHHDEAANPAGLLFQLCQLSILEIYHD